MTLRDPGADPSPVGDEAHGAQSDAAARQRLKQRGREVFERFITLRWVPLTAAFLSLPLSATAIFLSLQQPEVLLVMPDQIRVAQGRQTGSAFVYFQPAFVSTGKNERVEVIRDMALVVRPPTGPEATFTWTEQIRLVTGPSGTLTYEHVGDAVPLMVNVNSAAAPLCLLDGPDGFFFGPGTYRFRFVADRVVAGQALQDGFSISLSAENIAFLDEPGTNRFLALPILR